MRLLLLTAADRPSVCVSVCVCVCLCACVRAKTNKTDQTLMHPGTLREKEGFEMTVENPCEMKGQQAVQDQSMTMEKS